MTIGGITLPQKWADLVGGGIIPKKIYQMCAPIILIKAYLIKLRLFSFGCVTDPRERVERWRTEKKYNCFVIVDWVTNRKQKKNNREFSFQEFCFNKGFPLFYDWSTARFTYTSCFQLILLSKSISFQNFNCLTHSVAALNLLAYHVTTLTALPGFPLFLYLGPSGWYCNMISFVFNFLIIYNAWMLTFFLLWNKLWGFDPSVSSND